MLTRLPHGLGGNVAAFGALLILAGLSATVSVWLIWRTFMVVVDVLALIIAIAGG